MSQVPSRPASLRRREPWNTLLAGRLIDSALHCTALHSAHAKAVQTPMTSQQLSGIIDPPPPAHPPPHARGHPVHPSTSAVPQATTVAYCAAHLIHKATSHTRQSHSSSLPVFQSFIPRPLVRPWCPSATWTVCAVASVKLLRASSYLTECYCVLRFLGNGVVG